MGARELAELEALLAEAESAVEIFVARACGAHEATMRAASRLRALRSLLPPHARRVRRAADVVDRLQSLAAGGFAWVSEDPEPASPGREERVRAARRAIERLRADLRA